MSKDTLKLVAVNFCYPVFVGGLVFSKVAEGDTYAKVTSSMHIELNDKNTSVRITVRGDNFNRVTVVPITNVSGLVYSETLDKLHV